MTTCQDLIATAKDKIKKALTAEQQAEMPSAEIQRWDEEVFNWLRETIHCEKVTLRICGEELQGNKDSDHQDRFFRPMWAYSGYVIGNEGIYGEPLSRSRQVDYYRWIIEDKKDLIYLDLASDQDKDPNNSLTPLRIKKWICLPLYYPPVTKEILVGILTLDIRDERHNFRFEGDGIVPSGNNTGLGEDLQCFLRELASLLGESIYASFTTRRENAQKALWNEISSKVRHSSQLECIAENLLDAIDPERLRGITRCEIYRRTVPADFQPDDFETLKNRVRLIRWYPEGPRRVFDQDDGSVISRVFKEKKPQIVFNMSEEKFQSMKDFSRLGSMLVVPIFAGPGDTTDRQEPGSLSENEGDQGPVMALVTLSSHLPNRFSYFDLKLVKDVMAQASAIIVRSSLTQFLQDVSLEITHVKPMGEMLYSMLGSLRWLFNTSIVNGIHLVSQNDGKYRVTGGYYLDENGKKSAYHTPKDGSASGDGQLASDDQVLKEFLDNRQASINPRSFESANLSPQWLPNNYRQPGFRILMMPVRFEREFHGILYVVQKSDYAQNPPQAEASPLGEMQVVGLKALADYVGAALHTGHMERMLNKLESATWRVMRSTNLYEALQIIADMARELTDAQASYVALLGPDNKTVRLRAVSLECGFKIHQLPKLSIGCGVAQASMGLTGHVINTRETAILNDTEDKSEREKYPYLDFPLYRCESEDNKVLIRSELVVPILLPGDSRESVDGSPAMGALTIDHIDPNHFNNYNVKIIKRFATVAAIAIEHYEHPAHPIFTARSADKFENDIFVALKFTPKDHFEWVKGQIQEVAKLVRPDVEVVTADATYTIGDEVWSYIANCDLFVADLSGQSPNVFYEIGLAHALNKPAILIGDAPNPPADLGGAVYLPYAYPDPGATNVGTETAKGRADRNDSFRESLRSLIERLLPGVRSENC